MKDYELFGPEWDKEMAKMSKKVLIMMLKTKLIKIMEMEKEQTKTGE